MINESRKIIVAMSGGIDSSVAALLLKNAGYDCIGITLKLYSNADNKIEGKTCCSYDDTLDAKRVAFRLGIPHYVLNFTAAFKELVIKNFIEKYTDGLTPNPCIECNKHIKFDKLLQRAKLLGYPYVATGHYARISFNEKTGRYNLFKAIDISKDQSYVLYNMTQEQLKYTVFPLGNMSKKEVRALALANGLHNSNKPDSQDICFVPDNDYASFIDNHTSIPSKHGDFVDAYGNKIGTHKGIYRYTIGQRRGLNASFGRRMYVCGKNNINNSIVLGNESDLYRKSFEITDINLISKDSIESPEHLYVKIRYSHLEKAATVTQTDADTISICYDEPQKFICPGQSAVIYDHDSVVGGGIIK